MEIKPVSIPVVKPVAMGAVKPVVAPIATMITPATAPPVISREASVAPAPKLEQPTKPVQVTEEPKPSVTEMSKEERLSDIKSAVTKVETKGKSSDKKSSSKKQNNKAKINKKSNKKKEVQEGEVVRKEPVKKTIEGIEIDYSVFLENEEEMKKKISEHNGNAVFMDITTTEMKTVQELWEIGKAPYDRKMGEYVLSYDAFSDTLNKVFVDEILSITTERYYDDVRAVNPVCLGHYHIVYHRGRRIFDKINDRTFDYIMGSINVKEYYEVTVDTNTRCRFHGVDITKITNELYEKTVDQKIRESSRMTSISYNDDVEGGE